MLIKCWRKSSVMVERVPEGGGSPSFPLWTLSSNLGWFNPELGWSRRAFQRMWGQRWDLNDEEPAMEVSRHTENDVCLVSKVGLVSEGDRVAGDEVRSADRQEQCRWLWVVTQGQTWELCQDEASSAPLPFLSRLKKSFALGNLCIRTWSLGFVGYVKA